VKLTDLYPEMYPAADGYVTRQPFDAADLEHLNHAFELAGAGCKAIVTNGHALCALRLLRHVHEKRLPDLPARVFKAAAIHEAMIVFRIDVAPAAVRCGSVRHRIDGLPGIAGNRQHGFARVSRVGDRLLGEK
jgi:hypothetical protein